MSTLHIHLDESGELKFSSKNTSKYYIFAAAWTFDPLDLATGLTKLRFNFNKNGLNLDRFHASPDQQLVRDAVVSTIASFSNWKWVAVVIEKSKVNPVLRDPHHFYPKFAAMPLRFILKGRRESASRVLIYTDTLPIRKKRESVEKTLKTVCRAELLKEVKFCSFHHPSMSNAWLQVADYCAWAVARKWERQDTRTYDILKKNLACVELEALRFGSDHYY